jgi:hypothetical protein
MFDDVVFIDVQYRDKDADPQLPPTRRVTLNKTNNELD